ncbi:MAG: bifunctional oligoribonuclease/PAP phosphatase NrnA, partial [Leptospiraceae bacterium]|nr:bifunctional oligoribonuclease/PAP phosphatase NrnA [Leptospiraceae bacterium]
RNDFVISTHRSSDPDGIGAELGLKALLDAMGKRAWIVNPDPIAEKYKFLDPVEKIICIDSFKPEKNYDSYQLVVVDNSNIERLDEVKRFINYDGSNLIVIEQHDKIDTRKGFFLYPDYASTSEIIYELLEEYNVSIDYNTALALYLGIVMDTGQFKYNKTQSRTHLIVSKLLKYNFPTEELMRKLYEEYPLFQLLAKKDVFQTLNLYMEGKIASVEITRELLKKYNCSNNPVEDLVNELLGPKGMQVSLSFTESLKQEQIKLSFRSKGNIDVCSIAKQFSGGGHKNAAGGIFHGTLKEAKEKVLEKVYKLLEHKEDYAI